jgi:hypothetical protein
LNSGGLSRMVLITLIWIGALYMLFKRDPSYSVAGVQNEQARLDDLAHSTALQSQLDDAREQLRQVNSDIKLARSRRDASRREAEKLEAKIWKLEDEASAHQSAKPKSARSLAEVPAEAGDGGGERVPVLGTRLTSRFDCQGYEFQFGKTYEPPLLSCFRDARERVPDEYPHDLPSVFKLAASLNCEGFINVLLVSNSQRCFLDNYVTNVNRLSSFPVMVSVAADPGAHDACLKLAKSEGASLAILLCAESPTITAENIVIGKDDYGTSKFGQVAWQKVPTIRTALKLGLGVMLADIDMVWHHNPAPYLLYSDTVVETQCHQCKPADNLGLIVAFPGTEPVIDEWASMMSRQANDNDAFRMALTAAQERDHKAFAHCMPRKTFGFAIGLGDEHLSKDGTDYWPLGRTKRGQQQRLNSHFIATSDKSARMQDMKIWHHTLYGPETCTLKSGLFSCSRC